MKRALDVTEHSANVAGLEVHYRHAGDAPILYLHGVPTNSQDWYDYVYAAVSRYKGSIKYWEMWNEPNLAQFFNGTRQQYIDLFKVGADAAHVGEPDCFVLGPEISSAGTPATWMTDVLNQAGNKVDIIAFHQYDGNDTPAGRLALMDSMRNTINNAGFGGKPIWITESGFRSDASGALHSTGSI